MGCSSPWHRPLSPQVSKPLLCVVHGQCDARSTVTFPGWPGWVNLGGWLLKVHRSSFNAEHSAEPRPNFGNHSLLHSQIAVCTQVCAHCSLESLLMHRVALSALCCNHHSPITISTKNHWVTSFTTYWHLADVMYNIACIQLQSRVHTPRVSINIVAPKFTSMVLVLEVHRSSANTHSVTNKWLHLIEKLITVIKCTQS